jgi:hypothetical protein
LLHELLELLQYGLKASALRLIAALLSALRAASLTASKRLLQLLQGLLNLLDFRTDALVAALLTGSLQLVSKISAAAQVFDGLLKVMNSRSQPADSFHGGH